MSFPRYPKYKASGVEWLGEIPEHWEIWKLAHAFSLIGSGTTPKSDNPEYYQEGNIPWVNTGDLNDSDLEDCERRVTGLAVAHHSSLKIYPAGSVLIAMYGATIGKLGILHFPATVNQACCVFGGKSAIVQRFMFYLFLGLRQQILSLATGGGQPNVSQDILRTLRVGCPADAEQTRIAEFLDQETAKIDELVAEQQRLMELLKEKRQAVISHAVTKGLNPKVNMKPSGIEWLGDVPAHWTITPLKWLTDPKRPIMYGIVLPGPDVVEGVPILKGGNVKPSRMNLPSMARTTPNIEAPYARARLKEGDLVYAIRGTIGDCEPVPAELTGSNITQDVARVAIANGVCASWARWALLTSAIREDLACGSLGAAVRGVNIFDLKRANIPTPPPKEQAEIAAFIDRETSKLEQLTAETQRAIDLLQERRTALISAAVTGQIDVRQTAN